MGTTSIGDAPLPTTSAIEAAAIGDTFEQYKIATNQLSQWLVNTVRQDGDITQVFELRRDPLLSQMRLELAYWDLVELSRLVLRAASPLRFAPDGIQTAILLAESAIRGRKESVAWYGGGDQGHYDFIRHLGTVLRNLKQARESSLSRPEREDQGSQLVSEPPKKLNGFEMLELHEPSAEFANFQPIAVVKDKLPEIVVELQRDSSDELFQVLCYLRDCHEIRGAVRSAWTDFVKGSITLATVGEVTEAATRLIEQLTSELLDTFPTLDTMEATLAFVGDARECAIASFELETTRPGLLGDLACTPARDIIALLIKRREALLTGGTPPARPDDDFTLDAVGLTQALRQSDNSHEGTDGFERITRTMFELTNGLLSFSCRMLDCAHQVQMYLDIYDALGPYRPCLTEIFSGFVSRVKLSLLLHDSEKDMLLLPASETMSRAQGVTGARQKVAIYLAAAKLDIGRYPASAIQLPLYVAFRLRKLLKYNYFDGLSSCEDSDHLLIMVHLYRALRDGSKDQVNWMDLEWLIANQGAEVLGLSALNAQTPLLSAAKQFGQAMGIEWTSYTKRERHKRPAPEQRIALPTPEASKRQRKLLHTKGQIDDKLTQGSPRRVFFELAKEILSRSDDSPRVDRAIQAAWNATRTLSSAQLIEITKTSLQTAELGLVFDYRKLLVTCTKLLNGISLRWNNEIMQARSAHGLSGEYRFRDMVDELLWGAAIDFNQGQMPGGSSSAEPQHCGLEVFAKVGAYLKEKVHEIGSECYDEALTMTGGHLEDDLIPKPDFKPATRAVRIPETQPELETVPSGPEDQVEGSPSPTPDSGALDPAPAVPEESTSEGTEVLPAPVSPECEATDLADAHVEAVELPEGDIEAMAPDPATTKPKLEVELREPISDSWEPEAKSPVWTGSEAQEVDLLEALSESPASTKPSEPVAVDATTDAELGSSEPTQEEESESPTSDIRDFAVFPPIIPVSMLPSKQLEEEFLERARRELRQTGQAEELDFEAKVLRRANSLVEEMVRSLREGDVDRSEPDEEAQGEGAEERDVTPQGEDEKPGFSEVEEHSVHEVDDGDVPEQEKLREGEPSTAQNAVGEAEEEGTTVAPTAPKKLAHRFMSKMMRCVVC